MTNHQLEREVQRRRARLHIHQRQNTLFSARLTRDLLLSTLGFFLLYQLYDGLLDVPNFSWQEQVLLTAGRLLLVFLGPTLLLAILHGSEFLEQLRFPRPRHSRLLLSFGAGLTLSWLSSLAQLLWRQFRLLFNPQYKVALRRPAFSLLLSWREEPLIALLGLFLQILLPTILLAIFYLSLEVPSLNAIYKRERLAAVVATVWLTALYSEPQDFLMTLLIFYFITRLAQRSKTPMEPAVSLFGALLGWRLLIPLLLSDRLYKIPHDVVRLSFADLLTPLMLFLLACASFMPFWLSLSNQATIVRERRPGKDLQHARERRQLQILAAGVLLVCLGLHLI